MKRWYRHALAALFVCCSLQLAAQSQYTPVAPLALGDTVLSLPTSYIPANGTWEVKFTHRFTQSADQGSGSDRIHSLFGLDGGSDVGFGVAWVPRRDLQFSAVRTNTLDDIELAAKYVMLQQAPSVPVGVTLRGGADVRTERDLNDRYTLFAQVVLSRQFGRRGAIFIIPTYASNAGRTSVGGETGALFEHAFNVPIGFAVMLRPPLSLVGEIIPPNRDLPSTMDADFGWSAGIKRAIGGHFFEVMLTNNPATLVDQYVSSTYVGVPLELGNVHLGFNIERRF
jgi:hypothetical protein